MAATLPKRFEPFVVPGGLKGQIAELPVPEILQHLRLSQATGILTLVAGGARKALYLKDGRVVFASSNLPNDRLGEILLREGKITVEEYEASIKAITKGKRQGKVLVEMGALSPKDLWEGVQFQVKEIVYTVFQWDEGQFHFEESSLPEKERITVDLGFIPNDLRPRVQETLARCGDSAARSLLGVIAQARPLLTRERPQLDERAERETRENVLSLLEACCATAQSLTDLDRALAAAPENVNASPRALQVRQRLADQLARAATTLGDLYVAGLEQETDALSQVSQLTAAIHEDAEGRRTAMEEIRRVVAG